jgi:chromosome segregation ATPase
MTIYDDDEAREPDEPERRNRKSWMNSILLAAVALAVGVAAGFWISSQSVSARLDAEQVAQKDMLQSLVPVAEALGVKSDTTDAAGLIDAIQAAGKDLSASLVKAQAELASAREANVGADAAQSKALQESAAASEELAALRNKAEATEADKRALSGEREALDARNREVSASLSAAKDQLAEQQKACSERASALSADRDAARAGLDRMSEQFKQADAARRELAQQHNTVSDQLRQAQSELKARLGDVEKLNQENSEFRRRDEPELRARFQQAQAELEQQIARTKDLEVNSASVAEKLDTTTRAYHQCIAGREAQGASDRLTAENNELRAEVVSQEQIVDDMNRNYNQCLGDVDNSRREAESWKTRFTECENR